ncbi:leucine--tRNA ligase [Glycocaulis abyssi]|uniref:Leucine--tRNA ligase n=1 Tax=Glycocaulis abyssi TaxID=1433403 RepID=A0ABV9NCN6_9PROT
MSDTYDFTAIETKWRQLWAERDTYRTPDPKPGDKTFYVLDMFPYPSGSGLHVGHPVGYLATDIVARYKRMAGFNVLHPMGWDSFGLPAEQHAIKTGEHPEVSTAKNIKTFRRQMDLLGLGYDWNREIATSKPDYYKWTQFIFVQMYEAWFDKDQNKARPIRELPIPDDVKAAGKLAIQEYQDAHRLVYFDDALVNWCAELGTILSNEEVFDGKSEQGFDVVRVPIRQVKMRITAYTERLLAGLEGLDWPEGIKDSQRNWIGRSEGVEIRFAIDGSGETVTTFTTRADTLAGVTFLALAPEHKLVASLVPASHRADVDAYCEAAARKSDLDRTVDAEKTGVPSGLYAINPVTGAKVQIFVADYVLPDYGTGAVMGVPAHDERDFAFAKKYGLPVVPVIDPGADVPERQAVLKGEACWTEDGIMLDPPAGTEAGLYSAGQRWRDAREAVADFLENRDLGRRVVSYNLRDWIFSRQRYWGEPIPIIHWEDGTRTSLDVSELPLTLPHVDDYKPTSYDAPALARAPGWVEVTDPKTGMKGRRELNTMPQWAGSCWYPLRFMDPKNQNALVDPSKEKAWGAVDLYVGGAEHATLHLLYARFWYLALHDLGIISTAEPFSKLVNQGMLTSFAYQNARGVILPVDEVEERGEGEFVHVPTGDRVERIGAKMSKSLRNVVTPDDVVAQYGSDAFRVCLMFMGPVEGGRVWETEKAAASLKFLRRVWNYALSGIAAPAAEEASAVTIATGKLVEAVTEDLENLRLNTAIAELMKFLNAAEGQPVTRDGLLTFLRVLAPFAPHMAEELWERAGQTGSVFHADWPKADADMLRAAVETIEIVVQEGGKKRGSVHLAPQTDDAAVRAASIAMLKETGRDVAGLDPARIIVVRDKKTGWVRLVNIPKTG